MEGKVALITGAARGMGRSHALRLAKEGADLVLIDACTPVPAVKYAMASTEDFAMTVKDVESLDRQVIAKQVDVRDQAGLDAAVAEAVDKFGHLDVVVANVGVGSVKPAWEYTEDEWVETVDVTLHGAWRTTKAAIPTMIAAGKGGSIVLISSVAGTRGIRNLAAYVAAKHGVIGLGSALANELAEHYIRVNVVQPGTTATPAALNFDTLKVFRPDLESPTPDDAREAMAGMWGIPEPWLEPEDISNAVLWFASDEARFVTGTALPVDLGWSNVV